MQLISSQDTTAFHSLQIRIVGIVPEVTTAHRHDVVRLLGVDSTLQLLVLLLGPDWQEVPWRR